MFVFQLRPDPHDHISHGHLALSGLQVRGHAMFSHRELPVDQETAEYAWIVEVIVGDLTGRLTSSHIQYIVEILQVQLLLVEDAENKLKLATVHHTCQHGRLAPECPNPPSFLDTCPSSEDVKYTMTRVSVDCVDLYLVEAGTALNVQVLLNMYLDEIIFIFVLITFCATVWFLGLPGSPLDVQPARSEQLCRRVAPHPQHQHPPVRPLRADHAAV